MGACGSKGGKSTPAAEAKTVKEEGEKYKEVVVDTVKKAEETTAEGNARPDVTESEEDDDDDVVSETEFMKQNPDHTTKMRTSVSAEAYGEWNKKQTFTPPVHPKTEEQKTRLKSTLQKSFMFRPLNSKEMDTVIDAMDEVLAKAGEQLITVGEMGDYLFVIEKGILECRKEINGTDTLLKTVEEGDVFGELALLYNTVRAANVIAKEDCVLWKLDRMSFTHIVADAAQKKRTRYEGFLAKVPLLKDMDNYERSQLCDGLQNETFPAGSKIITEGEEGDKFFIIEAGTLKGVKAGAEDKALTYNPGDFFGELALLKNAPRAATVNAETDCELLVLDRGAFKRLFGGSEKMIRAMESMQDKY